MTGLVMVTKGGVCGGGGKGGVKGGVKSCEEEQQNQISVLALLLAALRKSMVSCRIDRQDDVMSSTTVHHMEIGWPTNVRHVTHVTFDRFNGFLGLPVEFQVEIPSRVPSASASVFGVSAESMQCSFDSNGNSVPTILLLMQERLYSQGGLKAEGVFRINPENGQEERVRDQLNKGIVPDNIDVHCLAGLIKAWLRELPSGVLDGLSPEEVLKCNTEEKSVDLVKQLKPTEAALLDWAVGLMADVVEEEESNKMNARNIAMVFAPNMTRMSDPLTALMHAVQVMNLLKTLIIKTLRKREETATGGYSPMSSHSCDGPTDEEFDSQHETDTSCELRRPTSDYDNNLYNNCSGDEDEVDADVESLGEIEEFVSSQPDENKNVTQCFSEEAADQSQIDHGSPRSYTDNRKGNPALSTSNGEKNIGDADMIDKLDDESTTSDMSSMSTAG
ncbi:Rho GTPase-activating protein 3 [Hibiscus syriacus]|uniref:Rho GTPase-activating protein 3 n=1 Tax=Hibiscus syriacus TaxID=106335 RepID=A0A6A2ZPG0_HIBSY|nr:rho GTPase-activating protein 2-like [Hibiscus syriacus]KAE8693758.1 Rho GTPase-activating protein 3 [Hibiscus syriacus]